MRVPVQRAAAIERDEIPYPWGNPKHTKKSPIHENTNAKITCDFGDERFRIAVARLEKDIFVRTH